VYLCVCVCVCVCDNDNEFIFQFTLTYFTIYISYINNYSFVQIGGTM